MAAGGQRRRRGGPGLSRRRFLAGLGVAAATPVVWDPVRAAASSRAAMATVVDASALAHETVLVSAGRRGLDVELAPTDLVALTSATTAPIATTR